MEFNPFERKTIEAINDCRGAIKHCGNNSIWHLERAWMIREIDLEMSIFRGITAEEEAASALFYCLKHHSYKNADKLNFNEHKYKLGLYPFLMGIAKFLSDTFENETSPFTNRLLKNAF